MESALEVYNDNIVVHNTQEVQEITVSLFNDFVSFIDRTERTTKAYLTNLKQFMTWLKYMNISQPTRKDIIVYRDWLAVEHESITLAPETMQGWKYRTDSNGTPLKITCRATTIKAYLQSVKAFFTWTAMNSLYPNIATNIHTPKIANGHKKDSLTAEEVLVIENSITDKAQELTTSATNAKKDTSGRIQRRIEQGKRLYAIYLLAVNAGLRTIEISRANIKHLETKGGKSWIYIWGKGHSEADQRKNIAPEVKLAIDDYLNSRTDDKTGNAPLFVSTGNRSGGKRIAATTISTMLKRAMQLAGFDSERLTAHSLRHTTAANVMELTGNNIYLAQQYLRHSSPKTTEIYLENDTSAQDETIANQLFSKYHGHTTATGKREQLKLLLEKMTPEQLEQLTGIATAITK